MNNYRIKIKVGKKIIETLKDILPQEPGLEVLFIGKTPTFTSVKEGHYFQGRQGKMFWNKLKKYDILKVPFNEKEDDYLLKHGYGIIDIVKVPREYGNEPSKLEYKQGMKRILTAIELHKPKIIVFVYKKVLDNILKYYFKINKKSIYGFNKEFDKFFNSKVFVFPLPGTPCKAENAHVYMIELSKCIKEYK